VSKLLFITETGLEISILDATEPVRRFLLEQGIHDYTEQGQGPENKKLLGAVFCAESGSVELDVSLYRPKTKQGDPRIWFYGIKSYVAGSDVCAVFVHSGKIHLLNLTQSLLAAHTQDGIQSPPVRFFESLTTTAAAVADELLGRLREIASRGPLAAVCTGSTSIGRSIENALDIKINSDRTPDYHGIEIKSGRSSLLGRDTRANLFACVPDWTLSRCGSSQAILDEFGYARGEQFKLYCSISTRAPNPQGLVFELDAAERMLREICKREPVRAVAVWPLRKLEEYLAAKHAETFWVKARSVSLNGREHFELKTVVHTRNPNIPHLERMLADGTVTMDHLIKRKPSGGAHEKGPLFKIERPRIPELFLGDTRNYALC